MGSRLRLKGPQAGFSLIEALAALALTGLFLVTGVPLLVQLVAQWSAGTDRPMSADAWMSAAARIGDDLAQTMPLVLAPSSQPSVAFRGRADRIDFVRTNLGENTGFGLEHVSLSIVPKDNARVAVLRSAKPFSRDEFMAAAADLTNATLLLLLRRPVTFDYVDAMGNRVELWESDRGLPSIVELKLDTSDAKQLGIRFLSFPIVSDSVENTSTRVNSSARK